MADLSDVVGVPLKFRGDYDASGNTLPADANFGDFYKVTLAGTLSGLVFEINDKFLIQQDGSAARFLGTPPDPEVPDGYIRLVHQVAYNVDGGSYSPASAWQTAPINVETDDTGNNCVLAGNEFTLDAGTYHLDYFGVQYNTGGLSSWTAARLWNVTDNAEEMLSVLDYKASVAFARVTMKGLLTIASAKVFRVEHFGNRSQTNSGFGLASDKVDLGDNVYRILVMKKQNGMI